MAVIEPTPETHTLDRIMDALGGLPWLTQFDRAELFALIDTLPEDADAYRYGEPYHRTWQRLQHMQLDNPRAPMINPYRLSEACGWTMRPTAGAILAGLNRAAGVCA